MKHVIAMSTLTLGFTLGAPAFAQDNTYHTSTTTVQQNGDGSRTVDTTHYRTDAYGNTVKVTKDLSTEPNGTQNVTKRVEHDSTDAYGNQSKAVTNETTDAYGRRTNTR